MIELCIICKEKKDHFSWKNSGDGWICGSHFKSGSYEFIPDRIREDRKKFSKEILQPYRGGEISKEFVDTYPSQSKKMFSKKEISKARNVWK